MSTAKDEKILEYARRNAFSVVTLDADFHALLAVSGAAGPSVLRIRQEGLKGADVAALVHEMLKKVAEQWDQGVMVTINERVIRVHRLPVLVD